jgi:hypothetical protein
MPRQDRTGPEGRGPMTGGRRGLCGGSSKDSRGNFGGSRSGGNRSGGGKRRDPIRRRLRDGSCYQPGDRAVPDEKDAQHEENDVSQEV